MALESLVDVEQSKHELSAQGELKVSELPLTPPQTVFMELGDMLCCGKRQNVPAEGRGGLGGSQVLRGILGIQGGGGMGVCTVRAASMLSLLSIYLGQGPPHHPPASLHAP